VQALLFASLVSVCALAGTSSAEKVKANAEAKVYNRKGEQGKVLVRVKEGQAMTVLAKEGRWLKVRVSGRTGFIPRSYVDAPEADDDIQRNTRRRAFVDGRSTKRGFGGGEAPDDRVGADATGETDTSGSEDDDDGDDEKPSKPSKAEKPEKSAKKPAKHDDDEGDDDDSDDEKPSKSEKVKKPSKAEKPEKSAKKPVKGDDDEGDEEDPIEKKGDKKSSKDDSDDEGDDEAEPKDAGDADDEEKDTRKKAKVSKKTVAFADADKDSDEAFKAKPGDTLFVEETKGKWTEVSVEEGDIGWIETDKLEMSDGDDDDDGGDDGAARGGRRIIDVRARLGFSFFNQSLTSSGGTALPKWPDRYSVGSTTAVISLGGDLMYPYKKDYLVGGEITYDYGKATRGISFDPTTGANDDGMPGSTTSFSMHTLNVRGMFGYDFHKSNGMVLFGRLGYHFEQLLFADAGNIANNMAKLPSETVKGPMIGAAFAIPAITPKVGARISLDAILVGGSLSQTKGLEDGADPSVKKYVLGAGFTYRYRPAINFSIGYDFQRTSASFGMPVATSVRGHMGTGVSRSDTNHLITFGLAKAF
jgi:hypothetical protein